MLFLQNLIISGSGVLNGENKEDDCGVYLAHIVIEWSIGAKTVFKSTFENIKPFHSLPILQKNLPLFSKKIEYQNSRDPGNSIPGNGKIYLALFPGFPGTGIPGNKH